MYESFYNLRTKPFALLPDSDFLYAGTTHRAAYSLLEYGVLSQAPFIVLTGDPGMGKTSLLQKLIAEHRGKHAIGLVTNARYDVEHLLPWILLSLGLSHKQLDPVEAYHTFSEFLSRESKQHRRVILVIDEAQSLGAELLEELRLLSNLNDGKQLKLQVILSGQPDLHALLKRVDMTQFAQRVVADYHLEPLTDVETAQFIRHRLHVAGGHPSLLTNKACALVHRLSRGNPRLINQVCDIALTYGFAEQARVITSKLVAQAALDRTKGGILPLAGREDLAALAAAPDDSGEIDTPPPIAKPVTSVSEAPAARQHSSPQKCFEEGLALKKEGYLDRAIQLFERASTSTLYWLRAHAQIGLCYRAMGDQRAAIHAFRTALNDQSAPRKDVLDVQYFLARTLEWAGQYEEALTLYRRMAQGNPNFRDAAFRMRELAGRTTPLKNGRRSAVTGDGWFDGAIENLQRLIGSHK
ncbi:MAG TPA: AAA family ATPase [Nitrospira sp.]|nr:AAA family ATPase [Nitrospira sp.]